MKQKLKALASLCLALALTLCLTLPAWAAGLTAESTGAVTITGLPETSTENLKVTAYKIIEVNYYSVEDDKATTDVNESYDAPYDPAFSWVSQEGSNTGAGTTPKSVADWVRENHETYIGLAEPGKEPDNSVQDVFKKDAPGVNFAAFYDDLANAIRNNDVTFGSGYTVENGNNDTTGTDSTSSSITLEQEGEGDSATVTCNLNKFEMGSYLVLIEGGMKIYKPVVVNLTPKWDKDKEEWTLPQDVPDLTVKYSEPGITKTVTDTADGAKEERKYAQVDIGDTVTYTLVADVPQFPADAINKGYQISDILPDGMTLNADSITVWGYTGDGDTEGDEIAKKESDTGAYTLTVTDNKDSTAYRPNDSINSVTFNLNFVYDELHDSSNNRYTKLIVTYTATANAEIDVVDNSSNTNVNQNTAYLDYNNNPYEKKADGTLTWQTDYDTATVYTYGIKVDKKSDTQENNQDVYLPGAEFTLTKKDGATPIHFVYTGGTGTTEGTYRVATPTEIQQAGATTTTLTVGESGNNMGKLSIYGLDVGDYILTETKAPAGYNLLSQPKEFTITDAKDNDAAPEAPEEDKSTPDGIIDNEKDGDNNSTGYISFNVINTQGFTLPTTGGMGTVLFTAGGVVLMGAGLVLLVVFLRRRRAK